MLDRDRRACWRRPSSRPRRGHGPAQRPGRLHPRPRRARRGPARACPAMHLVGLDRDPEALARGPAAAGAVRATGSPWSRRSTTSCPRCCADLGRPRVQGVLLDLGLSSLQIDDRRARLRLRRRRPAGHADGRPAGADRGRGRSTPTRAAALARSCAATARSASPTGSPAGSSPSASGAPSRPRPGSSTLQSRDPGRHPQVRRPPGQADLPGAADRGQRRARRAGSVLPQAVAALSVGGRIAVLAYHSLEDRLVKQVLAAGARDTAPRDLPVVPGGLRAAAAAADPRGRAARRRRGRRQPAGRLGPAAGRRPHRRTTRTDREPA